MELTKPDPTSGDSNAVYQHAATQFRDWISQGVLQREPDPAIYVYHQIFHYAGQSFTSRGIMA
ncbi:MAG TPA: DUF1015 domain-containing protein, partial [Planctomycetaceae bacterium]|nr:DUF1015 domain-containing protein [Planctomycetaceae bacterium]